MSTLVLYCWCHSDSASVLLYFTCYAFDIERDLDLENELDIPLNFMSNKKSHFPLYVKVQFLTDSPRNKSYQKTTQFAGANQISIRVCN